MPTSVCSESTVMVSIVAAFDADTVDSAVAFLYIYWEHY
jgi:hypothetical protein